MATRSFIGRLLHDGSVVGTCCLWDGYPAGVGRILVDYYTDPRVVAELLVSGCIEQLGCDVSSTVFRRDCEGLPNMKDYATVRDMLRDVGADLGAVYSYVFDDGGWNTYTV